MKNKKIIYAFLSLVICIVLFSIIAINNTDKRNSISTTSTSIISNKKIGWGIKRNDNHHQPDLGSKNKSLIDQYNRNSNGKFRRKICISNI